MDQAYIDSGHHYLDEKVLLAVALISAVPLIIKKIMFLYLLFNKKRRRKEQREALEGFYARPKNKYEPHGKNVYRIEDEQ